MHVVFSSTRKIKEHLHKLQSAYAEDWKHCKTELLLIVSKFTLLKTNSYLWKKIYAQLIIVHYVDSRPWPR